MLALIDGDIVAHRVGFTTDDEPLGIAKARADEMLDGILTDTGSDSFIVWLSGHDNFRYDIYPLYKANRIGKPRPVHLDALKEHLVREWGARFAERCEADDALGTCQNSNTVICSIDKDLLQIPGQHYNFVKKVWLDVSELDGLKSFYRQILIGDTSDNIPGLEGVGPVKAAETVDHCPDEGHMIVAVFNKYREVFHKKSKWPKALDLEHVAAIRGMILLSGRLLKIRQSEDEGLWDSPYLKQMEVSMQLSTPLTGVDVDLFTEPTSLEVPTDGCLLHGQQKDAILTEANQT